MGVPSHLLDTKSSNYIYYNLFPLDQPLAIEIINCISKITKNNFNNRLKHRQKLFLSSITVILYSTLYISFLFSTVLSHQCYMYSYEALSQHSELLCATGTSTEPKVGGPPLEVGKMSFSVAYFYMFIFL